MTDFSSQLVAPNAPRTGYKLTKLGWIPEDWEVRKIRDIAEIKSGGTPDRNEPSYWGGDIPWITTTEVNFEPITNAREYISEQGLKYSSAKIFPAGTILMAMYGQGKTRGQSSVLQIQAATNQACAAILVNKSQDQDFIAQLLRFLYGKIRSYSNIGNQENLNAEIIKAILLPLPPLAEQRRIAAILSTWDRAIAQTEALLAQLRLRNRGLAQQLLTGETRVAGFEAAWEEVRYRDLLKQVKRDFNWDDNATYDLISVRRRSGGVFFRETLFGHQIKTKNLRTAKAGDFLFSKMQIVHGASGLVSEEYEGMKISGSYIAVVPRDPRKLDIQFFARLSTLPWFYHQTYISSYGVHIEKMTFDFKSFLKLGIKLPPTVAEQQAIARILQAADAEVAAQEAQLTALREQKRGLMQELLTGVIRTSHT